MNAFLKITLLPALLFCAAPAMGQSYLSAIGLRLGNSNINRQLGLTYNYRLTRRFSTEVILQSNFGNSSSLHLLGRRHYPIFARFLNVYIGGGPAIGVFSGEAIGGFDLLAGAELSLLGFNFSVDYKPNFDLTGRTPWIDSQLGFSARMVLSKGRAPFEVRPRDRRRNTRFNKPLFRREN